MSVSKEIANWALSLEWSDIAPEVQAIVKEHCADGIGNAIGGKATVVAQAALAVVAQAGDSKAASLWATPLRSSTSSAAFYNAILIHALDFDDTHADGLVHATAPTLPVAWALGESLNCTGKEVITAYAAGLEIITRLGAAAPHGFHARGLHATQVCGTIASALVSSRLMNLTLEQSVNAMGIAGSFSGGLLEFLNTGSSTKQIHPGIAAQAGITAATMAAHGASGPDSVLEGEYGIYRALADRDVDISSLTKDLGKVWQAALITIKPYPACQLSHVTLDALKIAWSQAERDGCQLSDIANISAIVHPDSAKIVCEPLDQKLRPKTAYDAKFSLPFSAASLVFDGDINVASFSEESIKRTEVIKLASKFSYVIGEHNTAAAAASGKITIRTFADKQYMGVVDSSSGSPGKRLSQQALLAKFIGQFTDSTSAREIFDDLLHIDDSPTIAGISAKIASLG